MFLREKLGQFTGLIIAVIVMGVCGVIIASRSETDNKDGGHSGVTVTPTAPAQSPAPSSDHGHDHEIDEALTSRILAFEAGYVIANPAKRLAAVKPYVTQQFLTTLPKKLGSSPAEQATSKLSYVIDENSWCDVELLDATTMYVTSTLGVTSHSGSTVVNTYQIRHETVWIMVSGQWFVVAEGQSREGEDHDSS